MPFTKKAKAAVRNVRGRALLLDTADSIAEARAFVYEPLQDEIAMLCDAIEAVLIAKSDATSFTELSWFAAQNLSRAAAALHAGFHSRDRSFLYASARLLGAVEAQLAAARAVSARTRLSAGVPKKHGSLTSDIESIVTMSPHLSGAAVNRILFSTTKRKVTSRHVRAVKQNMKTRK